MSEFIMAMGAEHTKPENLKNIIDTINNERAKYAEYDKRTNSLYIANMYYIYTPISPYSYAVE